MEIGGYELGTIIHMGANGPLWLTETSKGPGVVAIRGEREARESVDRWRAWAGIDSPHVVRLLDVVRHEDGQWAVVQEYVEGRPLDIALASHALRSPRTRRRVWEGVAAGVSALHEAGIVHGDISPANIIVDPQGRAVIIDIIDPPHCGNGARPVRARERGDGRWARRRGGRATRRAPTASASSWASTRRTPTAAERTPTPPCSSMAASSTPLRSSPICGQRP